MRGHLCLNTVNHLQHRPSHSMNQQLHATNAAPEPGVPRSEPVHASQSARSMRLLPPPSHVQRAYEAFVQPIFSLPTSTSYAGLMSCAAGRLYASGSSSTLGSSSSASSIPQTSAWYKARAQTWTTRVERPGRGAFNDSPYQVVLFLCPVKQSWQEPLQGSEASSSPQAHAPQSTHDPRVAVEVCKDVERVARSD